MSQVPSFGPDVPLPVDVRERPGAVTALAIIGIVFGALGVLCKPLGVLMYFVNYGTANPAIDVVKHDDTLFIWTIASTTVGWFLSILLLSCSIAALSLKEWARQGLLTWSVIDIVLSIVTAVVNAKYVGPAITEAMKASSQQRPGAFAMPGWFQPAIAVLTLVLMLALPVLMLIFMTRPRVKDAFVRGLRPVI